MAAPLIPIIAFIARSGIAKAIKKYGTASVKRAVTQANSMAKKKPSSLDAAQRLQQRQALQAARKANTAAAKDAMSTGTAVVSGAAAGKEAGKAINASRKKKAASASMTTAQKKAGGKLPASSASKPKPKPKPKPKTTSAADRVAREANNTPTPQEIARAKRKQAGAGQPKSIAQARKLGKDFFIGKDGKKKAAVTKEELAKSGLTLRQYLNKKKK